MLLTTYVALRCATCIALRRLDRGLQGERGEGVISSAIAVLIMAFLGAAMWVAFKDMFATTTDNTRTQVELIGR